MEGQLSGEYAFQAKGTSAKALRQEYPDVFEKEQGANVIEREQEDTASEGREAREAGNTCMPLKGFYLE